MSNSLWMGLALILGKALVALIGPGNGWRQMMVRSTSEQPDNQLRRLGGCLVVAGAVIAFIGHEKTLVSES